MKSCVCPNLLSLDYLKYNCMTLLILPRKTLNFNGVLGLEGRIQCCGKKKTNQIKSKPEDSCCLHPATSTVRKCELEQLR